MDKAWKRHSSVRELIGMGLEAEERRCWKFQCFVGDGKAIFDPGISFPFFKTGRTVRDDSNMRTVLVEGSDPTHSCSIFAH